MLPEGSTHGHVAAADAGDRIALVYLGFAIVWILLSDRVVSRLVPDANTISWFQTAKGLGFVLVSAAVLFILTRRYLDRAERTTEMLEQAYEQTLAGWAAALDIRDHSTGEHTARVTELTVALAQRYGIGGDELGDIRGARPCTTSARWRCPTPCWGRSGR